MTGIGHAIAGLIGQYGIPALFVTLTLESFGAPLPGESALVLAAGAAAEGRLDIWHVALAAWLAAVLGDNIGYLLGRKLGRATLARHGARFGITDAAFDRAEAVARRWGPMMVVVARFVVVLRQLNGLVAGTTGMPWPRFLVANLVGAGLWVGVWATLGYRFGRQVDVVPLLWHHLSLVMAIAVPVLIAVALVARLRRRAGN